LVFVSGLTVGDYLLWNWSLGSNRDVLALVSGLTLPPLAVACLWLLALSAARLIARSARRPTGHTRRNNERERRYASPATADANAASPPLDEPPTSTTPASTRPRKIAA
jgi:hypothetical protein